MRFHVTGLLRTAGNMTSKMASVVSPSSSCNGLARPNILYIPLIILKFSCNRCNKVKIYKVAFIDYMFIIMFRGGIHTFTGTYLQNLCAWNTNLLCLTGWSGTGPRCFKNINTNSIAGRGAFNSSRYCVIWCIFLWFFISN